MLPKFPYRTMTVTGVIHIILGLMIFIMICISFNDFEEIGKMDYLFSYNSKPSEYYPDYIFSDAYSAMLYQGCVIPSSIMVGLFGVFSLNY